MLTSVDLANLQAAQVGTMLDTCVIQSYARTFDSNGSPAETYTDGSAIACGVNMTPSRENWRTNMNATHVDATIRLPIATSIKSTDYVKVTHRFGVALGTALVFDVVGSIRCGPSGLQVDLAAVSP